MFCDHKDVPIKKLVCCLVVLLFDTAGIAIMFLWHVDKSLKKYTASQTGGNFLYNHSLRHDSYDT
jgi:hypothetical protein